MEHANGLPLPPAHGGSHATIMPQIKNDRSPVQPSARKRAQVHPMDCLEIQRSKFDEAMSLAGNLYRYATIIPLQGRRQQGKQGGCVQSKRDVANFGSEPFQLMELGNSGRSVGRQDMQHKNAAKQQQSPRTLHLLNNFEVTTSIAAVVAMLQ